MTSIIAVVSLVASNFLYQLITGHNDWSLAADRSWFQAVAIAVYCILDS